MCICVNPKCLIFQFLSLDFIRNMEKEKPLTQATAAAAAAANSLQSCPTLCDPIDGSSPNQSGTVTQNSKEKLTQAGV